MKECPRCHLQFPDTANFCPMDREKLVAVDSGPEEQKNPAKIKFSETQWFMAATNVETLQDSNPLEADEQTAKFSRDVDIPDDVRSQYSLNAEQQAQAKRTTEFVRAISAGEPLQEPSSNKGMLIGGIIAAVIAAVVIIYFVVLN